MQLSDFLTQDRIICDVPAQSKKRALEQLSDLIANDQSNITSSEIFQSLISRERLGGTGIGFGVAIPHGRLKNCKHTTGAFIQLESAIDYDSVDKEPVDLLFALIVPEESTDEHLQALSMLASMFNDPDFREKVRSCHSVSELHALMMEQSQH